jgi:hypothetical protein
MFIYSCNNYLSKTYFIGIKPLAICILSILLSACGGGGSNSSDSYETFAKSYGGSLNDNFAAVNETTIDGQQQFVVAGNFAESYRSDYRSFHLSEKGIPDDPGAAWLAGLTTGGDLLWQQGYSKDPSGVVGGDVVISRAAFDDAMGYWLAGSVKMAQQQSKLLVRRLDAAGNITVSQEITLTAEDSTTRLAKPENGWAIEVVAIEPATNGDLLLIAVLSAAVDVFENGSRVGSVNEHHALFVRVDASGNLRWFSHLPTDTSGKGELYNNASIAELSYGPIVIAAGDLLAGFSETGQKLWQQQKNVLQLETSYDNYFVILSIRDDEYFLQTIDPQGQPVSNEVSLSYNLNFDYLDKQLTRSAKVLSFAQSCRNTLSGGCETVIHSHIQRPSLDLVDRPELRTLRRIDADTGQLLGEVLIGAPRMLIRQVFYDEGNNQYQVVASQRKNNAGETVRLFTLSPDLTVISDMMLPATIRDPKGGGSGDNRDIYAGHADKWLLWDAASQRLLYKDGYFTSATLAYDQEALLSRLITLFVVNSSDLSQPIQSFAINSPYQPQFKVEEVISTTDSHWLLISEKESSYWGYQQVLNLNLDGQINWQKKWRLPNSYRRLPVSGSQGGYSIADNTLRVTGQDFNQGWGGLLAFSASDGSTVAGVNVLPADHQYTYSLGILYASSSQAQYLAAEYGSEGDEGLWVTKLNPDGDIVWQYQYAFQDSSATVIQPGQDIDVDLYGIEANEEAIYLLGKDTTNADLLAVIKLDLNGEVLWASHYRLGANEVRAISAVSAVLNSKGELVIAVTEQHADLDPNEVIGKNICNIVDETLRYDCLWKKNTIRRIETGYNNVTLLKINASGEAQWTKRYGGLYEESVADISAASEGGYLISGRSDSLGQLGEAMLIRTDDQGEVINGCQLNRPATLLSVLRNDFLVLRNSYSSSPVVYDADVQDANFFPVLKLPQLAIARACSGIATDPAGDNPSVNPSADGELLITVVGNGSVTSTPNGIDCPGDCSEPYANGEQIQLQVLPDPGWVFDKWSGELGCGSQLTMPSTNIACVAEFTQVSGSDVTLTVIIQGGPGAGEINSSESPIPNMQCINSNEAETTCTAVYQLGAEVQLQARAFGSNNNVAWSNCPESSGLNCSVTMDQNRTVTALFTELQAYSLTLNVVGAGKLSSLDGSLDCRGGNSGACMASYLQGSSVVLDFISDPSQALVSWGGDCAPSFGTQSNVLQLTQNLTCTAEFSGPSVDEYSLCTRVNNETGSAAPGSVLRSSTGRQNTNTAPSINCQYYPVNTQVTLTPQANAGFGFLRWDGFNCFNNMQRVGDFHQPVTLIDLPPDTTCTAVFRDDVNRLGVSFGGGFSQPGDLVVSVRPDGSGSFTSSGAHACEEGCNEPVLTTTGLDIWLRAVPVSTVNNDTAGWQGCDEQRVDPDGGPMLCRIIFQQSVGEQRDVTVNFSHFSP